MAVVTSGGRFGSTILELGGNNAVIVMDDADLDMASKAHGIGIGLGIGLGLGLGLGIGLWTMATLTWPVKHTLPHLDMASKAHLDMASKAHLDTP